MTDSSRTTIPRLTRPHPIAGSDDEVTESMFEPSRSPTAGWPIDEALTYSRCVMSAGFDETRAGTIRLAKAFIELHDEVVRLRLTEQDRMILQTLAWDKQANDAYPETCRVIRAWIETNETKETA
jgi:hypothetical protein